MKWMVPFLLVVSIVTLAGQSGAKNGEWTTYGADLGNTRYSPLDQINADNFSKLEIAWRFKTESLGPRPEYQFESTPLMVKGVVYSTAGTRRAVVALDAATGELMWMHSEREGERAEAAPRQLSGRGLAYWTDGKDERILYVTPGYRLVALDARTGIPVQSFGTRGVVDLKQDNDQTIDLVTGEVGLHSAPDRRRQHHHHRRGAPVGRRAARQEQRQGLHPRIRRPERQADVDLPHDSAPGRVRQRHLARRFVVVHRQHRARGRRCRSTKNWGWPICRSKRRPATTSAAIGTATTCSAKASSPSI